MFEIINEMGLIVKSAIQRDLSPVYRAGLIDLKNRFLKPHDLEKGFWRDADLAAEIRRASRKVLLIPSERVWHHGPSSYSALERADFLLGRAVFLGKYHGFGAGLQARLASIFGPLAGLRIGELRNTLAGQKIDGTQS